MENPGLRTLTSFLEQVHRHAPVNFSTLSEERRRAVSYTHLTLPTTPYV